MTILGGILCGGRSARMGRDKALLDADGRPLLQYVIERLRTAVSGILISARKAQPYAKFGDVVTDELSESCPLAGIHALLKRAARPIFVTACDMPYVNADLVRHLELKLGTFDAVLPQGVDGIEPLCAIYTPACVPEIEKAAAEGRWKITEAIRGCNVQVAEVQERDWTVMGESPFANLNLPADYEALKRRLGARPT